jgi:uncharacterized membrane protein (UPF0182 family)
MIGPRWSAVLDRLRSVDSTGVGVRDGPLTPGRVRAVPVRNGIGFVQPKYRWRPQTVPALSRVALLVGDTAQSIVPGNGILRSTEPLAAPVDIKSTAASLYAAMRAALQRGDWGAFGRAFDALGRVLAKGGGSNP